MNDEANPFPFANPNPETPQVDKPKRKKRGPRRTAKLAAKMAVAMTPKRRGRPPKAAVSGTVARVNAEKAIDELELALSILRDLSLLSPEIRKRVLALV